MTVVVSLSFVIMSAGAKAHTVPGLPNTQACNNYHSYAHRAMNVTYLNQLYQTCMRSGKRQQNVRKYRCGKGQYRYKYNGTWRCGGKPQADITINDAMTIIGIIAGFAR